MITKFLQGCSGGNAKIKVFSNSLKGSISNIMCVTV